MELAFPTQTVLNQKTAHCYTQLARKSTSGTVQRGEHIYSTVRNMLYAICLLFVYVYSDSSSIINDENIKFSI